MSTRPKKRGKPIGLLDVILGFFILANGCGLVVVFSGGQSNSPLRSGQSLIVNLLFVGALSFWFGWRRGWIQPLFETPVPQPEPPPEPEGPLPAPVFYRVLVPRTAPWAAGAAVGFLRALLDSLPEPTVSLSLDASAQGIDWVVGHRPSNQGVHLSRRQLEEIVVAYYPGAQVEDLSAPAYDYPLYGRYTLFKRDALNYFDPALPAKQLNAKNDPLTVLAGTMDHLQPGENLIYNITVMGCEQLSDEDLEEVLTVSAYDAGYRYQSHAYYRQDFAEFLVGRAFTSLKNQELKGERVSRFTDAETRKHLSKLKEPLYVTLVGMRFVTPDESRLPVGSALVNAAKALFAGSETKILEGTSSERDLIENSDEYETKGPHYQLQQSAEREDFARVEQHMFYLTADELATLWHLPHEDFAATGINWLPAGQVPMPKALEQVKDGIPIGVNRYGAKTVQVQLPLGHRTEHTTIVGKNGTGKSSLLHRMIHEDIAKGRGLCLIDPKGTLVRRVLQHSIPPEREQDVVILDIGTKVEGEFYPPPLNLLTLGRSTSADVAARRLLSVVSTIFDGFADKKMADTLNMALMALAAEPDPTLLDIRRLLLDYEYRVDLTARLTNFIVRQHWEAFEAYKPGQQDNLATPILWRLRSFYNNDHLLAITCHPDRLNLAALIASNKIVLVSLGADRNLVPDEERLILGAALVSHIEMEVMNEVIQDGPFMLYIDEAQSFVRTSLPTMLSQAREYGLGLVLANQYYKQLVGDTFDAVEGNASTLISFAVGKHDATALKFYMEPGFTPSALLELGNFKAAVSVVYPNDRQPAFSVETLPPPGFQQSNSEREAYLRKLSVERYTPRTKAEVIDWIMGRYGGSLSPSGPDNPPDGSGDDEWIEGRDESSS